MRCCARGEGLSHTGFKVHWAPSISAGSDGFGGLQARWTDFGCSLHCFFFLFFWQVDVTGRLGGWVGPQFSSPLREVIDSLLEGDVGGTGLS